MVICQSYLISTEVYTIKEVMILIFPIIYSGHTSYGVNPPTSVVTGAQAYSCILLQGQVRQMCVYMYG